MYIGDRDSFCFFILFFFFFLIFSFSREIEKKFTVEEFRILKICIYICACNKYQSNYILTELIATSAVQKFILQFNLVILKWITYKAKNRHSLAIIIMIKIIILIIPSTKNQLLSPYTEYRKKNKISIISFLHANLRYYWRHT